MAIEQGIKCPGKDRGEGTANLVGAASHDPLAFDAAMFFVAECIRSRMKVPEPTRGVGLLCNDGQNKTPATERKISARPD